YLWAFELDGGLHIEQVSVAATHARRGLGRALIEHAAGLARERGAPCLTLTTFAQVPWNAPYYERIGFRTLDENELSPRLRAIRDAEAAHGLGEWPRVCMRLDLCRPGACRPPVSGRSGVAFEHQAQALQCELVLDVGDSPRLLGHHVRTHPGEHHGG